MSSVDVSTNQLQSRGAIDSAITTESRPEILHYAGLNRDTPTQSGRQYTGQGPKRPNENPNPAIPCLEGSQCQDVPLHSLFYTQLAYPSDPELVAPGLGGVQLPKAPLHSLFSTQLDHPGGTPELLGLKEKQDAEASLHSLFNTQLDYGSGDPESVILDMGDEQHAEASLYSLFNTQA
ncbi:hypothetical protein CNMCM6805_000648 [Aspergillus fumigatiaffinis]|uniref:Uncharacterized protein n=1 Tax=Aspergillus fumigatiaffinis TaxID=340414 RepID=A0A8H4GXA0_9EURO|nr:hypothetical protein CNMCM6805_000648 [Aspergillus fumigatiaffinis]